MIAAGDPTSLPDCLSAARSSVGARKQLFIGSFCLGQESCAEAMPVARVLLGLGKSGQNAARMSAGSRSPRWRVAAATPSSKGRILSVIHPDCTLLPSSRSRSSRETWAAEANGDQNPRGAVPVSTIVVLGPANRVSDGCTS